MKKPFVSLNRPKDVIKIIICIALCALAISLFFNNEESIAVFANGGNAEDNSLYGLVGRML